MRQVARQGGAARSVDLNMDPCFDPLVENQKCKENNMKLSLEHPKCQKPLMKLSFGMVPAQLHTWESIVLLEKRHTGSGIEIGTVPPQDLIQSGLVPISITSVNSV